MGSRAKLSASSLLLVAPFSIESIFITCDLNLDLRFVLILNYKHLRTAGLTVLSCKHRYSISKVCSTVYGITGTGLVLKRQRSRGGGARER